MILLSDCPVGVLRNPDLDVLYGTNHNDFHSTAITHGEISVAAPVITKLSIYMPNHSMPVKCTIRSDDEMLNELGYEDIEWENLPRYCVRNGNISNEGEYIVRISLTYGPNHITRVIKINATTGMFLLGAHH